MSSQKKKLGDKEIDKKTFYSSKEKNNNIFQTTRFNHTMIFFKLTD